MWPVLSRVRVCQVAFRLSTGHLQVTVIGPVGARQQPYRLVETAVTVLNVRLQREVPGYVAAQFSRQRTRPYYLSNPTCRTHDLEASTELALSIGATFVSEVTEDGVTARVLADPEGNEFCLVSRTPPE